MSHTKVECSKHFCTYETPKTVPNNFVFIYSYILLKMYLNAKIIMLIFIIRFQNVIYVVTIHNLYFNRSFSRFSQSILISVRTNRINFVSQKSSFLFGQIKNEISWRRKLYCETSIFGFTHFLNEKSIWGVVYILRSSRIINLNFSIYRV